jgi:hypothetical protein
LCFAPPNSLFILGREFPRKRLSFVADWRRDGAPEAPFPTFSLYFSLFEGKARFWSVGLHHPDMQLGKCWGETSDGAPIIRVLGGWVIGNSTSYYLFAI